MGGGQYGNLHGYAPNVRLILYTRKNATLLQHFNLGLKLINCLISLTYVVEVRQILTIQLDLNYCKRLSNYINALINQNIQSPLLSMLFKIAVRDN